MGTTGVSLGDVKCALQASLKEGAAVPSPEAGPSRRPTQARAALSRTLQAVGCRQLADINAGKVADVDGLAVRAVDDGFLVTVPVHSKGVAPRGSHGYRWEQHLPRATVAFVVSAEAAQKLVGSSNDTLMTPDDVADHARIVAQGQRLTPQTVPAADAWVLANALRVQAFTRNKPGSPEMENALGKLPVDWGEVAAWVAAQFPDETVNLRQVEFQAGGHGRQGAHAPAGYLQVAVRHGPRQNPEHKTFLFSPEAMGERLRQHADDGRHPEAALADWTGVAEKILERGWIAHEVAIGYGGQPGGPTTRLTVRAIGGRATGAGFVPHRNPAADGDSPLT